jgi:NitT/TauT family transport system permease protein
MVLNSLPKIALGPVFIVWIGAGPAAIIVMILAISLIVTVLAVLNGFLAIDEEKIKLVQTFGGTKFQVLLGRSYRGKKVVTKQFGEKSIKNIK